MRGLKDKGVLITGSSRGIGFATARRFLEEGSRVFICSRKKDGVDNAISKLSAFGDVSGMVCDVSRVDNVAQLIEKGEKFLKEIDILINNAGIAWEEDFLEITPLNWDKIIAVNLRGMFLVAQAVAKKMVANGKGGAIVNMSSTNGLVGEDKYAHYGASKGGVSMLTKTMAIELGPHNIRVNSICPGYIVTPMSETIDDPEFVAAYAKEKIPLNRVGTVYEVAAAYAFLASDDASFVHGADLVIDGGQLSF